MDAASRLGMPSPKPGRKWGAEYQVFGAACGWASRERDDESTLLEHDPHIIIVRPRGGSAVKNGCLCFEGGCQLWGCGRRTCSW